MFTQIHFTPSDFYYSCRLFSDEISLHQVFAAHSHSIQSRGSSYFPPQITFKLNEFALRRVYGVGQTQKPTTRTVIWCNPCGTRLISGKRRPLAWDLRGQGTLMRRMCNGVSDHCCHTFPFFKNLSQLQPDRFAITLTSIQHLLFFLCWRWLMWL